MVAGRFPGGREDVGKTLLRGVPERDPALQAIVISAIDRSIPQSGEQGVKSTEQGFNSAEQRVPREARATRRTAIRKGGSRLKKHLGRVAEQYLADGLVMRVARLDLLREGVDVAEAALEGATGKDRIDSGRLVGPVGDGEGARNRMRAGEARPRAVHHIDWRRRTCPPVDLA